MPARQRGWARKRKGGWQACWRENGKQRVGPQLYKSKTEAERWLDDNLYGGRVLRGFEVTFAAHVDRYLSVHAAVVQPATIRTLRERLGASAPMNDGETPLRRRTKDKKRKYKTAIEAFGQLTLAELEVMGSEIADWQATLPAGYRHAIVRALRQVLTAAVRWKLIRENPAHGAGANPAPPREEVAFFASLADVDRLADELGLNHGDVVHRREVVYGPIVKLGVETGLRPSELFALERRDVDRRARVVKVRRTLVDGEIKEYGKTEGSRRDVPLTARAVAALDELAARIDTPLLFPSRSGGHVDLDNWRRREWRPALDAAGLDVEAHPVLVAAHLRELRARRRHLDLRARPPDGNERQGDRRDLRPPRLRHIRPRPPGARRAGTAGCEAHRSRRRWLTAGLYLREDPSA
jgi:integrase